MKRLGVRRLLLRIAGWGYLAGIALSVFCLISSAVTNAYDYAPLWLAIFLFSFFAAPMTVLVDVWLSRRSRTTKWAQIHKVTNGFGAMQAAFRYLLR
jgi:hypothetical protein